MGRNKLPRSRLPEEDAILERINNLSPEDFQKLVENHVLGVRFYKKLGLGAKGLLILQYREEGKFLIDISLEQDRKERSLTFVHEILHLALNRAGLPWVFNFTDRSAADFFEKELDKAAHKFLKENRRLVVDLLLYRKRLI